MGFFIVDYYELLGINKNISEEELYKWLDRKIEKFESRIRKDGRNNASAKDKSALFALNKFEKLLEHYNGKANYDKALAMSKGNVLKVKTPAKGQLGKKARKVFIIVGSAGIITGAVVGLETAINALETVNVDVIPAQTIAQIEEQYGVDWYNLPVTMWAKDKDKVYGKEDIDLTIDKGEEKRVVEISNDVKEQKYEDANKDIYTFEYTVEYGDTYWNLVQDPNNAKFPNCKIKNISNHSFINEGAVLIIETNDKELKDKMDELNREKKADSAPIDYKKYTVQKGDTPVSIANEYDITVQELIDANPDKNITVSHVELGTVINIPVFEHTKAYRR